MLLDEWRDLVCVFSMNAGQWTGKIKVENTMEIKLAKWVPLNQIERILSQEDFKLVTIVLGNKVLQ